MKTIFDVLDMIKARPTLYVGEDQQHRGQQLKNLEMLLYGYGLALEVHDIREAGRNFLTNFGEYVRQRHGWAMTLGPTGAVIENTSNEEEAWGTFWRLLDEFRAVVPTQPFV